MYIAYMISVVYNNMHSNVTESRKLLSVILDSESSEGRNIYTFITLRTAILVFK